MTAKEMFEELGYKYQQEKYNDNFISYTLIQEVAGYENHYGITFNSKTKCYHCWYYGYDNKGKAFYGMNLSIDIPLLKAINQQCKELGWLDEKGE